MRIMYFGKMITKVILKVDLACKFTESTQVNYGTNIKKVKMRLNDCRFGYFK